MENTGPDFTSVQRGAAGVGDGVLAQSRQPGQQAPGEYPARPQITAGRGRAPAGGKRAPVPQRQCLARAPGDAGAGNSDAKRGAAGASLAGYRLRQTMVKCRNKDPKGKTLFRYVPLSARAIETLRDLPRSVNGRVFQTSENAIKLAFPRACRRACEHVHEHASGKQKPCDCPGIEGLRFHDLRHEATSRFVQPGLFTDLQVASITGYKTLQMLKRYTHLRNADLADLLDKAGQRRQEKLNIS